MSQTYTLTPESYALPLLHAAKHTSHTVLGLFLGSKSKDAGTITIQQALPLLHNYTSLSPMAEVGLSLVREEAKGKGLEVVGVYVIYEGADGASGSGGGGSGLGRVGERVLAGLTGGFPGAIGATVDNSKLASSNPYTFYTSTSASSGSAKLLPRTSVGFATPAEEGDIVRGTLELIRRDGAHRALVDFDDHLEDSGADWVENNPVRDAIKRKFTS